MSPAVLAEKWSEEEIYLLTEWFLCSLFMSFIFMSKWVYFFDLVYSIIVYIIYLFWQWRSFDLDL